MLTCLYDNSGNIIVACEWRKVNEHCQFDANGKYIWVHTVEISKQYQNNGILYKLIKQILNEMPEAKYCWFRREKYQGRMRGYPRKLWERLVKERKNDYAFI